MSKVTRRAARRDKSESPIVAALKQSLGGAVRIQYLDVIDLLIGYEGRNILMEIKTGKGKLRVSQLEFLLDWPGEAYAVNNEADAINAVLGRLDMPTPRYAVGQWYCGGGGLFHQITAARYLLGAWHYWLDGQVIFKAGEIELEAC